MLFDMFSECYDVAALGGNIHPIYAIFTQKAQYQLRDNTPIDEPENNNPLGEPLSEEELRRNLGVCKARASLWWLPAGGGLSLYISSHWKPGPWQKALV